MRWAGALVLLAGCTAIFDLSTAPNLDPDGDGISSALDNCPKESNPDQSDKDLDGTGDACDDCVDDGTGDIDGDGLPNSCDGCNNNAPDKDMDGTPDVCEVTCPLDERNGLDLDRDGLDDGCDPCIAGVDADADGDGVPDGCDLCPGGPEHDEDRDGVMDACDNCPAVPNPMQENASTGTGFVDGVGDACGPRLGVINRMFFDPFTADGPQWDVQGPGWVVDPTLDTYTLDARGTQSWRMRGVVSGNFSVRTSIQLPPTGIGGGGGEQEVDVIARTTTSVDFIRCAVTTGGELRIYENNQKMASSPSTSFVPGQPFQLELTNEGKVGCRLSQASGPFTAASYSPPDPLGTVWVGVGGVNVEAAFAWVEALTY